MPQSFQCDSTDGSSVLCRIRDARKYYGSRLILDIRKLEMYAGECLCIIGENGSGKSTLLRILGGVARVSEGEVTFADAARRARIGYIPQFGGLNPEMTVGGHLRECLALHGLSKRSNLENGELLDRLELTGVLGRPIRTLSGGYQKLVGLCGAIIILPEILLLDEPFSGLDVHLRQRALGVIDDVATDFGFIAITAHEKFDMVRRVRYMWLKNGVVECTA